MRADRVAALLSGMAALIVCAAFVWLVLDLLHGGATRLSLQFLVSMPRDAGRAGGIGPVLVSTAALVCIALVVAVPVALGTALLLVEVLPSGSRAAQAVQQALYLLASVPSIVFGLFGNALFCIHLGFGFSILSGGLTLACMILPILVSTSVAGLRAVPVSMRPAAAALGLSRATTLRRLVLPAAAPALVAGLLLGIGRAAAETAALVYTSGYVARVPGSVFDSGRSLSVHVYDLAMNVPGGEDTARASALVLLAALLAINAVAIGWTARRQRERMS